MAAAKLKLVGRYRAWNEGVREAQLSRGEGDLRKVLVRPMPDLDATPGSLAGLRDEARLLSRLRQRNVLHVEHVTAVGGRAALVLEPFGGIALVHVLTRMAQRNQRLPLRSVVEVAAAVATAMDAATVKLPGQADRRVVHPGPDPTEILIDALGRVKLAGFRVMHVGLPPFSSPPGYAPPEGVEPVAGTSYGVGALLVHLLAGEGPPAGAADPRRHESVLRRAATRIAAKVGDEGWEDLVRVTRQAMQHDPAERLSLAALASELRGFALRQRSPGLRTWAPAAIPTLMRDLQPPGSLGPSPAPKRRKRRDDDQDTDASLEPVTEERELAPEGKLAELEPPPSTAARIERPDPIFDAEPPPPAPVLPRDQSAEFESFEATEVVPPGWTPGSPLSAHRGLDPDAVSTLDDMEDRPTVLAPCSVNLRDTTDSLVDEPTADHATATEEAPTADHAAVDIGAMAPDPSDSPYDDDPLPRRRPLLLLAPVVLVAVVLAGLFFGWRYLQGSQVSVAPPTPAAPALGDLVEASPSAEEPGTTEPAAVPADAATEPAPEDPTAQSEAPEQPHAEELLAAIAPPATPAAAEQASAPEPIVADPPAADPPAGRAAAVEAVRSSAESTEPDEQPAASSADAATPSPVEAPPSAPAEAAERATPTTAEPPPGSFRVVFRAGHPDIYELEVRCHQGSGKGVPPITLNDAGKGPCRVTAYTETSGRMIAWIGLTGPATFTCFSDGQRLCN